MGQFPPEVLATRIKATLVLATRIKATLFGYQIS